MRLYVLSAAFPMKHEKMTDHARLGGRGEEGVCVHACVYVCGERICVCIYVSVCSQSPGESFHSHKCRVTASIHEHVNLLGIEAHVDTIVVHNNEYDR